MRLDIIRTLVHAHSHPEMKNSAKAEDVPPAKAEVQAFFNDS